MNLLSTLENIVYFKLTAAACGDELQWDRVMLITWPQTNEVMRRLHLTYDFRFHCSEF